MRSRKHCGTSETLQHQDRFFRAAIEIGKPSTRERNMNKTGQR